MSDLEDRDRLIAANHRATGETALCTPCCQLTPKLDEYLLVCPCGRSYEKLKELVEVKR